MAVNRKFRASNRDQTVAELRRWFGAAAGTVIRDAELALAATILPNLFGYHIVQLGTYVSNAFIASSRISHAVIVRDLDEGGESGLVGRCDALPIASNSVDVLVAPHILEFADEPHAVLREAERVLIGEGYIVVAGFNPFSWCGVWRLLNGWRDRLPWSGRFMTASRVKDWLQLLGFEIEFFRKTSFGWPIRRTANPGKTRITDQIGARAWPFFGNIYIIVARKHVPAATPLKASWKTRRRVIAAGVAEPSTRIRGGTRDRRQWRDDP